MNKTPSSTLKKEMFDSTPAMKLRVGEIVLVRRDETFPADLILLSANGPVFMETRSLDGEQSLKKRNLPRGFRTYENPEEFLTMKLNGSCTAEAPNRDIYSLNASIELNGSIVPINVN